MNKKLSEVKKRWLHKLSIPRPYVGVEGNFNSVKMTTSLRHFTVSMNVFSRLLLSAVLGFFGPGLIYLSLYSPNWNHDMPLYVKFGVYSTIAIATYFFIKFSFFPRSVEVDILSGDIHLKKNTFMMDKKIASHQIQNLKVHHTTFTSSKGQQVTELYIMAVVLNDQTEVGLFVCADYKIIERFVEKYPFKELKTAA